MLALVFVHVLVFTGAGPTPALTQLTEAAPSRACAPVRTPPLGFWKTTMSGSTDAAKGPPAGDHLEIKDSRTGKVYFAPITDETIRTADLKQIKVKPEDFGIMGYDPAFMNTASCRSAITFIDGDKGILRYRGYPIEQLAEKATFLEVAWV